MEKTPMELYFSAVNTGVNTGPTSMDSTMMMIILIPNGCDQSPGDYPQADQLTFSPFLSAMLASYPRTTIA